MSTAFAGFPWVLPLLLTYLRIQAILLALPVLGEGTLTVRVKVAMAAGLAPLFVPADVAVPAGGLAMLAGAELVTGLIVGMLVRILAQALDIAATILAQSASLSQIMGTSEDMPPHPIGAVLHLAGAAVLMAMGLPIYACNLIADSFALRPLGSWPTAEGFLQGVVGLMADSFTLAAVLAAPFIVGGFLFQLLAGVVARVMPSLPITLVTAPAAILLALVALTILTPTIMQIWGDNVLAFRLWATP